MSEWKPDDTDWEQRGYTGRDWGFNFLALYSFVVTLILLGQWIF